MKTRELTPEAFAVDDPIVCLRQDAVDMLKSRLPASPRRRMRICAHREVHDQVQEMLIAFRRGVYIRPHKHIHKSESFHIVEGMLDVVVFSDDGDIVQVIPMGDYHSGRVFYYRIADPYFHTILVRSDVVVLHETSNGPFVREANVFAAWSPDETDSDAARQFLATMDHAVAPRTTPYP